MSGRVCLSQPRTWSKERFSMTRTTRVLMGDLISWVGFLGNGNCWEGHNDNNRKRSVRTVKWGRRRIILFLFFSGEGGFFFCLVEDTSLRNWTIISRAEIGFHSVHDK